MSGKNKSSSPSSNDHLDQSGSQKVAPDEPVGDQKSAVPFLSDDGEGDKQRFLQRSAAQDAASTLIPPTRAYVLVPVFRKSNKTTAGAVSPENQPGVFDPDARLAEAEGLALAIDLDIISASAVPVATVKPATLFGTGKIEELLGALKADDIELVIIDHLLSPGQQRNLERAWSVKVLDRTGLILEIFGRRARTKEGRLQVELAHLTWQKSRLVRSWTHLERQRGGVGFMGGPGETQIESDRRMIQDRIISITRDLEKVRRTRALHRDGRKRVPYPVVAFVGYTNAGKSTLFNRLTGANVMAEDQLFATLDPTMREIRLASNQTCILSDTVGFISDLPTTLIAAFRATLEEVLSADIILHVRDVASPQTEQQKADVELVLTELGVDPNFKDNRSVEIWNKIDLLSGDQKDALFANAARKPGKIIPLSAVTGAGVEELLQVLGDRLAEDSIDLKIVLAAADGRLANWIYESCEVLSRTDQPDGTAWLKVQVHKDKADILHRHLQSSQSRLVFPGETPPKKQ